MKTVLQSLILMLAFVACSGTPSESGIVLTGGGTPAPPPVVKKTPGTILTLFAGINMPISCNQAQCGNDQANSLQALDDFFTGFQNLPRASISFINLNDSAQAVIYDAAGATLTFPSQIVDANVQGFLAELTVVSQVELLIGIKLSFSQDPFRQSVIGTVLSVLKSNRQYLQPYKTKITWIDFVPNQNSFSAGIWTVDRTKLQTQFQTTLDVIKPDL